MSALADLAWREPLWLWLALYPWLLWGLRAWRGRRPAAEYAEPDLLPWARASRSPALGLQALRGPVLLALAWLLFALALAGPRVAETRYGEDAARIPELMIVFDLSRSMTARDLAPSRLERARLELLDLLARAEGMKIGLTVYAARPHLITPPTADLPLLRGYLELLRHGLLPTEGSDLQGAIERAAGSFVSAEAPRALLLVTDGELAAESAAAATALEDTVSRLRGAGIALFALGVGSPEGAPLSGPDGAWLRHDGRTVESVLREARLETLAHLGGGRYAAVADTDADWRRLYEGGLRRMHAAAGDADAGLTVWRELYAWCLLPGLALFVLAQARARIAAATPARALALAAALAGTTLVSPPARAADFHAEAYAAYARQAWTEARRLYARVPGYAGRMGEAGSAYRAGDYAQAIPQFTQAMLEATDDGQRARALLNLANSHYRLEDYAAAVQIYSDVLRYRPGWRAAEVNLEYATAMAAAQARERERRAEAGSTRQGRGPRTRTPPPGTEVTGDVSISEDEPPAAEPGTGRAAAPGLPDATLEGSRPVVREAREFDDPQWTYAPITPARILLEAEALDVDPSRLWQRIFEAEEDFPAPLEAPRELPGVVPW